MIKRHSCKGETPWANHGPAIESCQEHDIGTYWVDNGEYASQVNYCPYCGKKAPKQVGEQSMAYSRFLGSDVYMAPDGSSGVIWCFGCSMNDCDDKSFTKRTEAIEHLKQHMAQGDIVGGHAIPLLEKEIQKLGDEVRKTG